MSDQITKIIVFPWFSQLWAGFYFYRMDNVVCQDVLVSHTPSALLCILQLAIFKYKTIFDNWNSGPMDSAKLWKSLTSFQRTKAVSRTSGSPIMQRAIGPMLDSHPLCVLARMILTFNTGPATLMVQLSLVQPSIFFFFF